MRKIAIIMVPILIIFFGLILVMGNTSVFGYRFLQVATGSMQPEINVGDIVFIKKSDNYLEEEVITYEIGESYVTHRIVSKNDTEIITKGDANNILDDAISYDKVVGKVIVVIPDWVATSLKFIAIALIIILLFPILRREEKNV